MTDSLDTRYGRIYFGGECKDDYPNMQTFHDPLNGQVVTLQGPAMDSFHECERRYARRSLHTGWSKKRRRPIMLTGSLRSCAFQRHLWLQDSHRFANPNTSGHPRGLCIDVVYPLQRRVIRTILLNHGWHQVRPDEPWHFSYGVTL